ncbi:META domain-containing protein [Marinobacterium lutimaris]|uniref:Heat shock protein HslJ n=1 Tax=Marinobacterium lutimaris TaxID=568106 RepID=A0A1H5WUD4_9GAMM|nr:META domain-containing protein [Marinobacterium lutimaris]SEG02527.1 Heat shock protein HslJ [Marinobacterium lutimaris]
MMIRRMCGYISVLTMSVVLSACSGNQVADQPSALTSADVVEVFYSQRAGALSGRWLIQSIGDRAIDTTKPLVIAFDDRSRVGGLAGCNRFLGDYMLTGNEELALQSIKVTRRICADPVMMQERLLLNRLENVYTSRFTPEGALLLFFDENEKPIRLSRDPESVVESSGVNPARLVAQNQG